MLHNNCTTTTLRSEAGNTQFGMTLTTVLYSVIEVIRTISFKDHKDGGL